MREGEGAAKSVAQVAGAAVTVGATGGGGGGITAVVAGAEVVSNSTGLGDICSLTPEALPASLWSGDMPPSLLDSSSNCTYKLGCFLGSPSLVLLNINCPSVDVFNFVH